MIPICATINATSPRETIPAPTILPSFLVKPNTSLEYFPAQNLDKTAKTVITMMNQISLMKLAKVIESPMSAKKNKD